MVISARLLGTKTNTWEDEGKKKELEKDCSFMLFPTGSNQSQKANAVSAA